MMPPTHRAKVVDSLVEPPRIVDVVYVVRA
jgi:hypothetical protein